MMKLSVVAALLALAGCATPTTGVVPRNEGLATVTHQGSSGLVSTDSLKAAAIQEADAYCQRSGKRAKVVRRVPMSLNFAGPSLIITCVAAIVSDRRWVSRVCLLHPPPLVWI